MVLPQDSICPEKLASSSPDLKCPKKEAPGDKGGEDSEAELEEARDITSYSPGPSTHRDSQALHKSAPVEPGDHQATHWVTR